MLNNGRLYGKHLVFVDDSIAVLRDEGAVQDFVQGCQKVMTKVQREHFDQDRQRFHIGHANSQVDGSS